MVSGIALIILTSCRAQAGPASTATASPDPTASPVPTLFPTPGSALTAALRLGQGPHLFLDDYLISYQDHLSRTVSPPSRLLAGPVVTGYNPDNPTNPFKNFNYSAAVLYDAAGRLFRMWYVAYEPLSNTTYTAYTESADGLLWQPPRRLKTLDGYQFSNILDLGPGYPDPQQRYLTIVPSRGPVAYRAGNALFSPDGLTWTFYAGNPLTNGQDGEVWTPYFDPLLKVFGLLHRWNLPYEWHDAEGQLHQNTIHDPTLARLIAHSSGQTPTTFTHSNLVFEPDALDSGETQFYATSNVLRRGDYLITALSVLRDDLKAAGTPAQLPVPNLGPRPVYGTGYSVLAWSRDGQHWFRDRAADPFLLPASAPTAWDHAIAWINAIVPMGDRLRFYYGGYQYGHKVYTDRQVGVADMPRDRYVAEVAGSMPGRLKTPLVIVAGNGFSLNVDASRGELQVQFEDALSQPIPGFSFHDCRPITTDGLQEPLVCRRALTELAGRPVVIEFVLRQAALYAFNLGDPHG